MLDKLKSLDCEFVAVPANMTHFFQPLDLTVNRSAKQFMRKQFVMYYSEIVRHKLENGESVKDIEVDLRLSTTSCSVASQHVPWIGIFSPVKYFGCKIFAYSNFCRQAYVGYRSIYVHVMHTKYFACLIFVSKGHRRKYFNDENFPIYGITLFTSSKGPQIIVKGWKKAGISGLLDRTTTIPPADPFSRFYSEV